MKTSNTNSLAHTTWECKYHLVFARKYRRQIIYRELKADVGRILRELCDRKGVEIIEAECCPDHIHMLVRIPPKYSVSEAMGYLKGKSSLIIFDCYDIFCTDIYLKLSDILRILVLPSPYMSRCP